MITCGSLGGQGIRDRLHLICSRSCHPEAGTDADVPGERGGVGEAFFVPGAGRLRIDQPGGCSADGNEGEQHDGRGPAAGPAA